MLADGEGGEPLGRWMLEDLGLGPPIRSGCVDNELESEGEYEKSA